MPIPKVEKVLKKEVNLSTIFNIYVILPQKINM